MNKDADNNANNSCSNDITERVKAYLSGYGASSDRTLVQLAIFKDWRRLAQQELERRAYSLMQYLDDDILQAIVINRIDIAALINEVEGTNKCDGAP